MNRVEINPTDTDPLATSLPGRAAQWVGLQTLKGLAILADPASFDISRTGGKESNSNSLAGEVPFRPRPTTARRVGVATTAFVAYGAAELLTGFDGQSTIAELSRDAINLVRGSI